MPRIAFFSLVVLGACGPSTLDDASNVQTRSQELQALVEAHVTSPASTSSSSCAAEMESYRTAANQLLASLGRMCPGLDECMSGMGHADQADLASGVRDLQKELDAHVGQGCVASDLGAEMNRHHQVMVMHCQHLATRSGSMMGMMEGRGMMQGRGCR